MKNIKGKNINTVIIVLVATTIISILMVLYLSLHYPSLCGILTLAGSLILIGSSILGFELYRQQKKQYNIRD